MTVDRIALIGSTAVQRGVPESIRQDALLFDFHDAAGLECRFAEHCDRVAAVVLWPTTAVCPSRVGCGPAQGPVAGCCRTAPCTGGICGGRNLLHEVQDLCRAHGAEMCRLSAFIESIAFLERHDVCGLVW